MIDASGPHPSGTEGGMEDAYRQYLTLTEIRPDDPTVLLLLAQAAAGAYHPSQGHWRACKHPP